jgi:(p)ppGpp synthase/HD superfamily hydrolase
MIPAANLSHRFEEALIFAAQLHREQLRKGTNIPYIAHLLAVAGTALEHGADEDEAIAALLHDGVEDQGGMATLAVIREKFGARVADIVEGCTDAVVIPKPPWRKRKAAYVAHVPKASASIRLVSASDKLHNARSILSDLYREGENTWARFNGGKEGTLWYYRALVEAFRTAGNSPLVDELDRVVTAMEQFR